MTEIYREIDDAVLLKTISNYIVVMTKIDYLSLLETYNI